MKARTDDLSEVGMHVFERAQLGIAPFRFVGISENVFNCGDGTSKAGGSCDYCGTGIRFECWVSDANGKQFKVGSDCIGRCGDTGLIKAYKNSPEARKHQRDIRARRQAVLSAEYRALIEANADQLRARAHPTPYFASQGKTYFDYLVFVGGNNVSRAQIEHLRTKLEMPVAA